ncbi:MoaF N-terminal domain-containing protein [Streptomyces sp. NPDC005820]|uniref:MoaF-related domain-containing protein n=1 Tax=Streptomyces sp. NPDC005820 TaxID=3157069 RepID=UPI0034081126
MSELTYAGKKYRFSVDNGVVFHNTYAADGTGLHWEAVAGAMEGSSEDVRLRTAEVTPGVFLIGWTEKSGMTVTHAMNLNTHTVHAFWTYETPDGRVAELHTGTLEEM